MRTLDDAWRWYWATREQVRLLGRLCERHWDDLPDDERLRALGPDALVEDFDFSAAHLDDFAVLILFSVFESLVRERAASSVREERERLSHALVLKIVDDAMEGIESGSFFRLLNVLKAELAPGLVEEVNQVRRYRNWVAHGRRSECPEAVTPKAAFDRLSRFLESMEQSPP